MYWRVTNWRKPHKIPTWRWVCGNYWRKLLWVLGLHWKQRKGRLTPALFWRRVRWLQLTDHLPWDVTLRRDPCAYCGHYRPFDRMTIEHVVPRSHGGLDTSTNKVGACAPCNRKRGAAPLLQFILARQRSDFETWVERQRRIQARANAAKRRTPEAKSQRQRQTERRIVNNWLRASIGERIQHQTFADRDAAARKATDVDLRG